MPADNPQLGETWSMLDPSGNKVEAVLIALSRDQARLISRNGRRITIPLVSLTSQHLWHFEAESPETLPCSRPNCPSIAYLRYLSLEGETWVCPSHIPAGALTFFPQDDVSVPMDTISCPCCSADDFELEYHEKSPTPLRVCVACQSKCILAFGGGQRDNGWEGFSAIVLSWCDLLSEGSQARPQVLMGSTARQFFERHTQPGSPILRGPIRARIITSNRYGESNALVVTPGSREPVPQIEVGSSWRLRGTDNVLVVQEFDEETVRLTSPIGHIEDVVLPLDTFLSDYTPRPHRVVEQRDEEDEGEEEPELTVNAVCVRREEFYRGLLCRIQSLMGDLVQYEVFPGFFHQDYAIGDNPYTYELREDFLAKWRVSSQGPGTEINRLRPQEGTYWKTSNAVVRICAPTRVQRQNDQIVYQKVEIEEVTSMHLNTFLSTFKPMPRPLSSCRWVREGHSYDVKELLGDEVVLSTKGRHFKVSLVELMLAYEPLLFGIHRQRPVSTKIYTGGRWVASSGREVVINQLGHAGDEDFVCYTSLADGLVIAPLKTFLKEYTCKGSDSIRVGDEWLYKGGSYTVEYVSPETASARFKSPEGFPVTASFSMIEERFQKVERQSRYAFLEEDDDEEEGFF